jgi:hypothetical protein
VFGLTPGQVLSPGKPFHWVKFFHKPLQVPPSHRPRLKLQPQLSLRVCPQFLRMCRLNLDFELKTPPQLWLQLTQIVRPKLPTQLKIPSQTS